MQLTNIARDVLEDAGMGRRYLPASWVGNLAPKQIVALAKTTRYVVIALFAEKFAFG